MLHKQHKYDLIVMFAVLALLVSLYLAITTSAGLSVPCSVTGGCQEVLYSKYSHLAGIPLPYLGVAYFGGAVVLGLLSNHYKKVRRWFSFFLGAGMLAALGFLSLQFLVLKKICQYCLVTDLVAVALFLWDFNIDHISES